LHTTRVLQAALAAATAREAAVSEEKNALKGALAAQLAHREEVGRELGAARREVSQLNAEVVDLKHQVLAMPALSLVPCIV
jgi:chromosome segregation ATPase